MNIKIDNITEINSCKLKSYPNKSIGYINIDKIHYYPGNKNIQIAPDGFEDMLLFIGSLCNDNSITIEDLKEYIR